MFVSSTTRYGSLPRVLITRGTLVFYVQLMMMISLRVSGARSNVGDDRYGGTYGCRAFSGHASEGARDT